MTSTTDEKLMAYADEALAPDEHTRIAELVASDPVLQKTVAIFRETNETLARLYAGKADEPVPRHLIELIENFQPARTRPPHGPPARRFARLWRKLAELASPISSFQLAAVGAAVTFIAGIGIGLLASQTLLQGSGSSSLSIAVGPLAPESPLNRYLTTRPGDREYALPTSIGTQYFRVALTFRSKDGRYCRAFRVRGKGGNATAAVACLKSGGTWQVQNATLMAFRPARPGDRFESATQLRKPPPAVEATIERLIDDIPLGPDDEMKLIASKWR